MQDQENTTEDPIPAEETPEEKAEATQSAPPPVAQRPPLVGPLMTAYLALIGVVGLIILWLAAAAPATLKNHPPVPHPVIADILPLGTLSLPKPEPAPPSQTIETLESGKFTQAPATYMPPPQQPEASQEGKAAQPSPPEPKVSLTPAPAPDMIEDSSYGPLPKIAADGRQSWRVYARPFDKKDTRPRISIVMTELGLSEASTDTAINDLPGAVTLAFAPYPQQLGSMLEKARDAGHEVLLSVPMEPTTYPKDDPGRMALLTSLSEKQNIDRLHWIMSRSIGYVGLTHFMGSKFTTSPVQLRPVLGDIKRRGLLFLDLQASPNSVISEMAKENGLPYAVADRTLDDYATPQSIDDRLGQLEDLARQTGSAVAVCSPYPITFERLKAWAPTLAQKGILLAPLSAVVKTP